MELKENTDILVLEDSVTDFDLLRYQLKADKVEPTLRHANSQDEFIASMEASRPDLVIADFNLPTFNGLEALKYVKSEDPFLPFILLSGSISHDEEREILQAGADDVIRKSNIGRIAFAIKRSLKDAEDKIKLQEATYKLQSSLQEKEVLIQEIHHRVKNNLAVVSGLLELKKFNTKEARLNNYLNKIISKIKSIALVHEMLYQSQNFSVIDFNDFLGDLIEHLTNLYKSEEKEIEIKRNDFDLLLNVNQAIPLGLMISELTINSVQHAFEDVARGIVEIEVIPNGEEVVLRVADNGVGRTNDTDTGEGEGYGVKIIQALIKQIEAEITVNRDDGTEYLVTFQKRDKKGIGNALL